MPALPGAAPRLLAALAVLPLPRPRLRRQLDRLQTSLRRGGTQDLRGRRRPAGRTRRRRAAGRVAVRMAFDERGRLFVAENRGYPIGPAEPPPGPHRHARGHARRRAHRQAHHLRRRPHFSQWRACPGRAASSSPARPTCSFSRTPKATATPTSAACCSPASTRPRARNCASIVPRSARMAGSISPRGWPAARSPRRSIPEKPPVKMTGDLRWNPRTGDFENVDGRSQYGMSFDDFGRRFICMNRLPVQHVVISSHGCGATRTSPSATPCRIATS